MKTEREFLDFIAPKFGGRRFPIPAPRLTPEKRLQRRLSFRNQIHLHRRTSAFSNEQLFSAYSDKAPFPVISNAEWWGDGWNARDYYKEFGFDRSFFDQFRELRNSVPHPAQNVANLENSDYCNNASGLKDCYLVFSSTDLEGCVAVAESEFSNHCLDSSWLSKCERCFDCTLCRQCTELQSSVHCEQCHNSLYLYNCRSCTNCLFCVNLRMEEYCIFNQRVGKSAFKTYLEKLDLASFQCRAVMQVQFTSFLKGKAHPNRIVRNVDNCTGNFIYDSRNVRDSYMIRDGEDCMYCFLASGQVRSCRDYTQFGQGAELLYECSICGLSAVNLLFCYECWLGCNNLLYCALCPGSSDCFACVGLHKGRYCIFNKQYSATDYHAILPKIIDHMITTGEWGEFFPMQLAPVPYNESLAQRFFPKTEQEASQLGLMWQRPKSSTDAAIDWSDLPDRYPESDLAIVVKSMVSGHPFSISPFEIQFYQKHGVPLPRLRYDERMDLRNCLMGEWVAVDTVCTPTGASLPSFVPAELEMTVWDKESFDQEFQ